jgi:methionyl-tRNA synthetase
MPRKILVTAALPYANGPIHIGHLVEYLQADFWTRFQKMRGNECTYICADDTHGTAIMIKAREQKITPEQLIQKTWDEHTQDFKDFQIAFDHYSSTNSPENKELCDFFFGKMKEGQHISSKPIEQLYCDHDKMFLPDRFVKGTCPKCGAKDQYGDSCDKCASTYSPSEMKEPYCSLCKKTPVMKHSENLFFKLNDFKGFLEKWIPEHTPKEISPKILEWFNEDLRDWDISRDEPYFGFNIPGYPGKYFYVWVDAPMGYISSFKQWCQLNGKNFNDYWLESAKDKSEVYHFIGKDIVRFHTLFWPAMLKSAQFRTPSQIFVHGMLTVNGEKMSKSKGTNIAARTYLKHQDPSFLRYYYACKLSSSVDDLDLNLEDFTQRVNSDLIGKITNLGSRGGQMLSKKYGSKMTEPDVQGLELIKMAQKKGEEIAAHFENRDFSKGISEIRFIADEANRYFDEKAPWKNTSDEAETLKVLTSTLNLFRIIAIYLKPILPHYVQKVEKLFNESAYDWNSSLQILTNHTINNYEHLAVRVDPVKLQLMVDESKVASPAAPAETPKAGTTAKAAASDEVVSEIEYDDFMKVDLRVAKIIAAEEIKEANKLLRLTVSLGTQEKQIIAGIRSAYKAEDLVGRLTVVVANLKPRKMKFGMSEGMVLAAGEGGTDLFILSPDSGAQPGQRIK